MGGKRKEKAGRFRLVLLVLCCMILVGAGGWLAWSKFEGRAPVIEIDLKGRVLGAKTEITGSVSDARSGVRKVWAGLIQDGKERVLMEQAFGAAAAHPGEAGRTVPFTLSIDTRKLGLQDGEALLRMAARDHSWRHWWKGNPAYIEKEIVFDTRPPNITVLTRQHNVSQGGSGLVIYRLSEACGKSGVSIGDDFFPGYTGFYEDPAVCIAFFALPYDQGAQTEFSVRAVDKAGNAGRSRFYHYVRERRFKQDTLTISDRFLKWKMPEFAPYMESEQSEGALIDQFLHVNQTMRNKNNAALLSHGRKTEMRKYWQGAFGRLPNAARRASFADRRRYLYQGEEIDRAVHMGVDLASVRQAPVPAANAGKVVFAGNLGIYGNTVLVDHGYGLFSVYSHLSRFAVEAGSRVEKGDVLGNTGNSGLAGGDHLHFGMFIDHVYVNPVEWWDASWIENNITAKLEKVRAMEN
jgi:murein DD-endopeptidase MepM/ murein hydrolase activator NlpD